MKYKINEKRILEILHKYDDDFEIEDNEIKLKYSNDDVFSVTEDRIEHIKRGCVDPECAFFDNMIVEKLHEHFDECFEEEDKQKYSYKKCKAFLEENGVRVYDTTVTCTYFDREKQEAVVMLINLKDIVKRLNGCDKGLSNTESLVATVLQSNKDKLLESGGENE